VSKNILIVEDSSTTRAFISSAIESCGSYEVYETATGFEALKLMPQIKFNMIVTDINMPDINGLELISFVRSNQQYKNIPLVIISTEGTEMDRQKGMVLGANEYLVKPFKPEELQEIIKRYIG
jgi:two-component system chemotaxis response regulator CheY